MGPLHTYSATITWTGAGQAGTASYTSYSRNHEVALPGKPVLLGTADPAFRGQRIGTRLVEYAVALARETGVPGVCLTTFSEVPWNGPLYRRLGFVEVPPTELGDDLRRIRVAEGAAGLDVSPRIAMRRPVDV